jgi:putative resolvase
MKSCEVLGLLKVSRITLSKYVRTGKIKVTKLGNNYYDYDEKSIYKFLGYKDDRIDVIYARVSTYKQKEDLKNQINNIKKYCDDNSIVINEEHIFKDISSGLNFKRNDFSKIFKLVKDKKVNNVYITYKDRLTRLSFRMIEEIFESYGTHIIFIKKNISHLCENENELLEDIISLIHILSTKMYSNRRKKKLNIISQDLELEKELSL